MDTKLYPVRWVPWRKLTRAEYNRLYNNGWRASANAGGLDGDHPEAWEDGYLDYAAGRDKWHLRDCPDHDTCGEA